MGQFDLDPTMRSALKGANATIQCTGKKDRNNKTAIFFIKIGPLRKFGVLPS